MELEMPDWTCRAVRLAWLREEGVSTTFSSSKFWGRGSFGSSLRSLRSD